MRLAAAGETEPEAQYPLVAGSFGSQPLRDDHWLTMALGEFIASGGDVSCWKANNFDTITIRASLEATQKAHLAQQQFDTCIQGGMDFSAYGWVYWDWNPTQTARLVSELIDSRPCRWVWWDMEDEHDVPNSAGVVKWMKEAIAETERLGLNSGIYTGLWWYNKYLKGNTDLSYRPLWDANYSQSPYAGLYQYGGWDQRLVFMHQFSSSYQLCGRELDANGVSDVYYTFPVRGAVTPPPPPEPPPPDHDHQQLIKDIIERLYADNDNPSDVRKALHMAWITEQMAAQVNGEDKSLQGPEIRRKLTQMGFK